MPDAPPLPYLDMEAPEFSTRSQPVYAARAQGWCARTPYGLAVLRHREVGQLLRDRRLRQGSYAWPDIKSLEGSFAAFWKSSIISQEGDAHRLLRRVAVPALADDHILSLKPRFDAVAEALAAKSVADGRCEFISAFSEPFAGQAICVLLNMPLEQWPRIAQDASRLGKAMGPDCKRHEAEFNAACDRLLALADELMGRVRLGEDRTGFVARAMARFAEIGVTDDAVIRNLVVMAIFGGVDTTRAQLGFAVALFIEHPEQWTRLREDPSLIPGAIDEVIRTRPTTTWSTREALEDFEFGGVEIKRGETLHMLVHASGRDPAICADERFDVAAPRKAHFGFGGGAHACLGRTVARTDMTSALEALARRVESFRYDGEPVWLPDSGNTSPAHLPIAFSSA